MEDEKHTQEERAKEESERSKLAAISRIVGTFSFATPLLCVLLLLLPNLSGHRYLEVFALTSAGVLVLSWPITALASIVLGHAVNIRRRQPSSGPAISGASPVRLLPRYLNLAFCVFIFVMPYFLLKEMARNHPSRSNEGAALGATRTIFQAQQQYLVAGLRTVDGVPQYADLASLIDPGPDSPALIANYFSDGTFSGYKFDMEVFDGDPPRFMCTVTIDRVNYWFFHHKQFFVDETGVYRYTDDGTVPTAESDPVQ